MLQTAFAGGRGPITLFDSTTMAANALWHGPCTCFPCPICAEHGLPVGTGKLRNYQKENAMIAKIVILLAMLSLGSISLTACNTVQGAGKDVERAGEKVQQEAQEHKRY